MKLKISKWFRSPAISLSIETSKEHKKSTEQFFCNYDIHVNDSIDTRTHRLMARLTGCDAAHGQTYWWWCRSWLGLHVLVVVPLVAGLTGGCATRGQIYWWWCRSWLDLLVQLLVARLTGGGAADFDDARRLLACFTVVHRPRAHGHLHRRHPARSQCVLTSQFCCSLKRQLI